MMGILYTYIHIHICIHIYVYVYIYIYIFLQGFLYNLIYIAHIFPHTTGHFFYGGRCQVDPKSKVACETVTKD